MNREEAEDEAPSPEVVSELAQRVHDVTATCNARWLRRSARIANNEAYGARFACMTARARKPI
jgi:hypothetical protein